MSGTDTDSYRGTRAMHNGDDKLTVHHIKDQEVSLRVHDEDGEHDYEFAGEWQAYDACSHILSTLKGREVTPQELEAL